jgi:hypothetical protein
MPKKKTHTKKLRTLFLDRFIDFILIIISVSGALAVNTWAGNRNDQKRLTQYYKSFTTELNQDIEELNNVQSDAEIHIQNCTRHLEIIRTNGSADSIIFYFKKLFSSELFGNSNMISYKSMLSSGDMKLIENLEVKKALMDLEGSYTSVKFQDDIYSDLLTKDLMQFLNANFDLSTFSPVNPNFYKQMRYKNMVVTYRGLNQGRLLHYKSALHSANKLHEILLAELKKH